MTTKQHITTKAAKRYILPGGEVIEKAWNSTDSFYLAGAYPYLLDGWYYTEDELYDYVDSRYSNNALNEVTEFFRTCVDD